MMQYWKKRVLGMLFAAIFVITTVTPPALAAIQDSRSEVSGAGMAFDLVILRPLGIVTTVIGCGFFIISLPFTVWTEERIKQAGSSFVGEPGSYTFVRPLGDLNESYRTENP
jgi:hypothetical protein